MIASRSEEYDIREFGEIVNVPNNPTARCMYYLNCVSVVLDLEDIDEINYLTDYQRYWRLSLSAKKLLLRLCMLFEIDVLDGKVFFEENDLNTLNNFYELGQTEYRLSATSRIVVAGVNRKVLKIMLYRRYWIIKNFYNAVKDLTDEIRIEELTDRCTIS